jgi:hypothetical protein
VRKDRYFDKEYLHTTWVPFNVTLVGNERASIQWYTLIPPNV